LSCSLSGQFVRAFLGTLLNPFSENEGGLLRVAFNQSGDLLLDHLPFDLFGIDTIRNDRYRFFESGERCALLETLELLDRLRKESIDTVDRVLGDPLDERSDD